MPYIHVDDDEAIDGVRKTTSLNCGNQMVYKHGKPWWNDGVNRRKLIRPAWLSDNSSSRLIW
jgi:hypothetical protein